jgi:hypothetical protein
LNFIKSRLRRLEEHIRGRCQECGLPPHSPGHIVLFGEAAPRQTLPDNPDERCGSCGRPLWCTLKVVFEDAEGSDAA